MGFLRKHPALVLGIGITLLFLTMSLLRVQLLDTLNLKIYDLLMSMRGDPERESPVVIVDIDDESIEKLGRWPWSRTVIAGGLEKIDAGDPQAIGLNFIFSEPEETAGLQALRELKTLYEQTVMESAAAPAEASFLSALETARQRLDGDAALAEAIRSTEKVILPCFFKVSVSGDAGPPPEILVNESLRRTSNPAGMPVPTANEVVLPLPGLLESARGMGHINLAYDMDGTARRERLVYRYKNLYIPSYTLRLAAGFLDVPLEEIRMEIGSAVQLRQIIVPTTAYSELMVNFKGPRGAFKRYSYFDVYTDKIPPTIFTRKLVLVSASASGLINPLSTPTDASMPLGEFSAHAIDSILHQRFVNQPAWSQALELGLILAIGLIVIAVFPRLRAMTAGGLFALLLIGLAGGASYAFLSRGLWVPFTYPLLQLVAGYIGVVSIQYFVTESSKEKVEGESAETNRMLGLSFQSQGMLDMAFDKFRRVPVDDQMKDILYNLALDFERKRQLNKAASVYEHIEAYDPRFKDVSDRKSKLMQASETMVFGDGFLGGSSGDSLMGTSTGTRPTLGRYEVERQLGKGAMGIVYLGKDPRINRTTAIKTFRLSEEFEPEDLEKMKRKFFREAESAGTLSHPNIVTIYDAGDEQDLAYIAMEFLEGEDLEKYTKKEHLLPVRKVIEYAADIADALDYAHQKGIVHRDIKPANVMLLKNGVVKITDFGIARITASSQTQTGVVKGTPYYMSPEQFSGEKVDGRSDIFSLGTMTYQLLTGKLPFYGDSPPALMNKILNVPHEDPRKYNPKVYKPLVTILDKALAKNKEQRYRKAATMAAHLRELGRRVDALAAKKKAKTSTD